MILLMNARDTQDPDIWNNLFIIPHRSSNLSKSRMASLCHWNCYQKRLCPLAQPLHTCLPHQDTWQFCAWWFSLTQNGIPKPRYCCSSVQFYLMTQNSSLALSCYFIILTSCCQPSMRGLCYNLWTSLH
jgi:hypothetical protein